MPHVITLPRNEHGRDFVVGDIHGMFDLLDEAMKQVRFDPARDRILSVGDLVDRGPHSERCLDFLGQPWFFAIQGNHEALFLQLCKDGRVNLEDIYEHSAYHVGWLQHQPQDVLRRIEAEFQKLPVAMEVETEIGLIGFVHAEVPHRTTWPQFKEMISAGHNAFIMYAQNARTRSKSKIQENIEGVARLFSGHTPFAGGIHRVGNCYFIDTGAVFSPKEPEHALTLADITCPNDILMKDISGPLHVLTKPMQAARPRPYTKS